MCPLEHTLGQPLVQQLALYEERHDPLAEAAAHHCQIDGRDMDETTLVVKASLQEQAVPARMEAAKRSRTLEDHDGCGAQGLAGGLCCEVAHQVVDEAADISVKPLAVSEEDAEDLGQVGAVARPRGEDELPVRQPQQELLVHVLAQKQGALLRTGGTKSVRWPDQGMEDAAAEGPKVLQWAVGALAAQARLPPWGLVHLILAIPLR
jgi:hypothetical protein